jgi:hypothetical protein
MAGFLIEEIPIYFTDVNDWWRRVLAESVWLLPFMDDDGYAKHELDRTTEDTCHRLTADVPPVSWSTRNASFL